jgi:hypothetical protein
VTADDGFDAYFVRNYGRLVAELHSIVGSLAEAEDAVQEAFARASVRWERLRDYDHPEAWVRRVALNLAVSSLRRARRRLVADRRAGVPPPAPAPGEDSVVLAQALGVVPMALYKHVANKNELLDGMIDAVVGEIDPPASGTDWKTTIRRRVLSARRMLLRHPWASGVIESRMKARANPTPVRTRRRPRRWPRASPTSPSWSWRSSTTRSPSSARAATTSSSSSSPWT